MTSWMYWVSAKSRRYVVTASPAAANAKPTSTDAGSASSTHGEVTRPMTVITTMNPIEVSTPLITADATSPSAMSVTDTGVGRIASYVRSILIRVNTPKLVWLNAVFIAVVARIAGATNAA